MHAIVKKEKGISNFLASFRFVSFRFAFVKSRKHAVRDHCIQSGVEEGKGEGKGSELFDHDDHVGR